MSRSLPNRIWYRFLQLVCRLVAVTVFRLRCSGREHIPAAGGALVLSNHQSHLDPVLVGLACNRRLNYVARQTLFKFPPLRWLIESLDAISLDRDGMGLAGLKETLKRLKRGEMVLLFPEGTRTLDGAVAPLKPGFCALAQRAGVPLLPVAIDGAFQAWPRTRKFPLPAKLTIVFGPPIMPAEIKAMTDRQLLAEVERRILACHHQAASRVFDAPELAPVDTASHASSPMPQENAI